MATAGFLWPKSLALQRIVGFFHFLLIPLSLAQCPAGTTISFEKIANVNVRGVTLVPLYTGQGGTPVSAECNNRCRAGSNCRAFILNYEKHSCLGMGYDASKRGSSIIATTDRTSFFEKICLTVPTCEKAWTFERVIGRQLVGFDDRVLTGIASRLRCQEICLKERQFVCRSGEYDYITQECRLSSEDRRTQSSFFTNASPSVDYFENQCSPLPLVKEDDTTGQSSECGYKRYENSDIYRADLMRSAFSEQQCRSLCDATRAFVCRSFAYKATSSLCWLSSDDTLSSGDSNPLISTSGVVYSERSACLNIKLDCNPEEMKVSFNTIEPFDGKIYAKEDPLGCESFGANKRSISLSLPIKTYTKCGVRKELDGKYSTTVIIQHHPVIQRKGDRMIRLVCNFETPVKLITNSYHVLPPTDGLGSAIVNATAPSPSIKLRITDQDGKDIHGARLGEELYLRIEMQNDSIFDLFARDLIARSGNNDEAITLLDSKGCPTDSSIFPILERVPGSRSLQGKFDAFKFADDEVVRFQVNVHFCLQNCAPTSCPNAESSIDSPQSTPSSLPPGSPGEYSNDQGDYYNRRRRRKRGLNDIRNNSYGENKEEELQEDTLLPDYPLQREIIVEGLTTPSQSSPTKSDSLSKKAFHSSSLFCTSKTTLLAAFIAVLVFQVSLIAFCCSCLFLWKFRPSVNSSKDKKAPTYSRGAYTGTWSSFNAIE